MDDRECCGKPRTVLHLLNCPKVRIGLGERLSLYEERTKCKSRTCLWGWVGARRLLRKAVPESDRRKRPHRELPRARETLSRERCIRKEMAPGLCRLVSLVREVSQSGVLFPPLRKRSRHRSHPKPRQRSPSPRPGRARLTRPLFTTGRHKSLFFFFLRERLRTL